MADYLNNSEIRQSGEKRENKEIEKILSPEQGVTLGSVVAGQLQQIKDDKKKLKTGADDGEQEFERLGNKVEAGVFKKESVEILNEAEKAEEEYINILRKDIPDFDVQIGNYKKQSDTDEA